LTQTSSSGNLRWDLGDAEAGLFLPMGCVPSIGQTIHLQEGAFMFGSKCSKCATRVGGLLAAKNAGTKLRPLCEVCATREQEEESRERELREKELREKELREKELREKELREKELREKELREKELREKELREKELREKELREKELREKERIDKGWVMGQAVAKACERGGLATILEGLDAMVALCPDFRGEGGRIQPGREAWLHAFCGPWIVHALAAGQTDAAEYCIDNAPVSRVLGHEIGFHDDDRDNQWSSVSPLMAAARAGAVSIMQRMLAKERQAILKFFSTKGLSEEAMEAKVRDNLQSFVNLEVHHVTPLCLAAANGHMGAVEYLLGVGAKVNLGNPLLDAVINCHVDIAERLLVAGAKVTTRRYLGSMILEPENALWVAVKRGDRRCAELLLRHGANPNLQEIRSESCGHDHEAEMETLLMKIFPTSSWGEWPRQDGAALEMLKVLVAAGANVNSRSERDFVVGNTVLISAARQGDGAAVAYLLDNGADIATDGAEALRCATGAARKVLVARGVKPAKRNA
jgi:ankyrin repeat protein